MVMMVLCCVVLSCLVLCMVRYGMVWFDMVGMVRYGTVWYGMVWYGLIWYGMVWCSIVWWGVVVCCWITLNCSALYIGLYYIWTALVTVYLVLPEWSVQCLPTFSAGYCSHTSSLRCRKHLWRRCKGFLELCRNSYTSFQNCHVRA